MTRAVRATAAASVPCLFPHSTIVCLGDGPSLTRADVDYCRGRAKVLAINYTIALAPWADVWYGYHTARMVDGTYADPTRFAGRIYSLEAAAAPWPVLRAAGYTGLSSDPTALRGSNSGHHAINLAAHLAGAGARIVLLGFDCQPAANDVVTWRGDHAVSTARVYDFARWLRGFDTLVAPLAALRIAIVNASRTTAIESFPRASIEEALA